MQICNGLVIEVAFGRVLYDLHGIGLGERFAEVVFHLVVVGHVEDKECRAKLFIQHVRQNDFREFVHVSLQHYLNRPFNSFHSLFCHFFFACQSHCFAGIIRF